MSPRIRRVIGLLISCAVLVACSGVSSSESTDAPAKAPDEAAAVAALKEINRAQADFIRRTRRYAQGIDELIAEKLLTAAPGAEGYRIVLLPSPDAVSYTAEATPAVATARHFFTDKSGVVRAEIGKPATAGSSEF